MLCIVRNYVETKSPIAHKYLNHGKHSVPIRKCYKLKNRSLKYIVITTERTYSTQPANNLPREAPKFYEDIEALKNSIVKENKGFSGIYMLTNKITGDIYIGQSKNLALRLNNYFNISYLKSKESLIISRALIKYGYANFSLTYTTITSSLRTPSVGSDDRGTRDNLPPISMVPYMNP